MREQSSPTDKRVNSKQETREDKEEADMKEFV